MAFVLGGCQQQLPPRKPFRQYSAEEFMNNTAIKMGGFSPDEKKVLYSSNETGIFNAFGMPTEGGAPYQFSNSVNNAVYAISYFPNDERILYQADRSGNENYHLYVLTKDGTSRDLTPDSLAHTSFVGWSYNSNYLYYTSNKRKPKLEDLYQLNVNTMAEELVFANDSALEVGAISNDDRYISLVREITFNKSEVFLLDRQSGKLNKILASEANTQFWPTYFNADGTALYCLTNEGNEFTYLMRLDLATGTKQKMHEEPWDILFASTSRSGRYTKLGINNNAHTEIKIIDNTTGKALAIPQLPKGRVNGAEFSRSERYLLMGISSSRQPTNLYVLDLETMRLNKLTSALNAEMQEDHLVEAQNVTYRSFDGLPIPALLYTPQQIKPGEKIPAVILAHSGPGGQSAMEYSPLRQLLVNHGYVVLAPNYRGSYGYGKTFYAKDDRRHGIDDLQDCIEAKKYLASLGYVDTSKVGILGASYGGYLALAGLTFKPNAFAVGVDMFGITDWVHMLSSIPPYWESFKKALYSEIGDPVADAKMLQDKSPLYFAHNIRKPLFVYQGANDVRVPPVESKSLVEIVKRSNVPVEYLVLPDEGHSLAKRENTVNVYGRILKFLETYLD